MAGAASTSAKTSLTLPLAILAIISMLAMVADAHSQSLYKYRGPDGEWIYTDKKPAGEEDAEERELPKGTDKPRVLVGYRLIQGGISFLARNDYHAPVQLVMRLDRLNNLKPPIVDNGLEWVLPPQSTSEILTMESIQESIEPSAEFSYASFTGIPNVRHNPEEPYRAPFAAARAFRVTQAYPMSVTHTTPESRHAVDIAMPIGTDVYAARGGVVFDVASTNFRGGLDLDRANTANLIRILHDDGTFAVYAHLNWNTIRVQPGDRVERGEYIADSGNTGFSSGPHLHFVVMRNSGLRLESVPVVFEGANSADVVPAAGTELTAY